MIKQTLYSQNKTIQADKQKHSIYTKVYMRTHSNNDLSSKSELKLTQKDKVQPAMKQLRILDYRNGKYQGIVSQKSMIKSGLGILIDDNYSFVLSEWKQNKIQGPFFMVYPDESILYGYIQKQKIGQIVCYEVNKQFNMILSKNSNILLVDLLPSNSILVFKIDKKLLDEHTLNSILKTKDSKQANDQINTGISLLSQQQYLSLDEKYKIYQKKLSLSNLPEYLKNYELFIRQKFQKNDLIEIYKTREDFTINFKTSAITLFLKLYLQTNQTKMLGSMNRYQNQYEFYRKILHNSNSVEEFVLKPKSPFTTEYNLRPPIRPKNCTIQLSNSHRSSVTYVNEFLNLDYMYKIKENLQKINELINIFVTNKFAQVQLQNSIYEPHAQDSAKKSGPINYTLEQVQQQIYDAVKRKKQGSGKRIHTGISPSRVTNYPSYQNKSNEIYSKSGMKKIQTTLKYNYSPQIWAPQNSEESRMNRAKSTLNLSNVSKYNETKHTPRKHTVNKSMNQHTASGRKYTYLDEIQNEKYQQSRITKSPVRYEAYQNMKRLTDDYENIQRDLEQSTLRQKQTRSPYRLDNSIYRKSANRASQVDIYSQAATAKHAPLSQKKVFKYLPI